ncbi:MAG: hypothetical protein JRC87_00185 [Deltaproteobacteria bacterium]|nr:hypothetical protein [Deltaproteobacteria bacterium]MBW2658010.1 hypothetical protein [Deltaproteobacteria bacterium]
MKRIQTSVTPEGTFTYGIHKPAYPVHNLRQQTNRHILGHTSPAKPVDNRDNFPAGNIDVEDGNWIFEIPNPFPFRGRTFIGKNWADSMAENPEKIRLSEPEQVSLTETLKDIRVDSDLIQQLPRPLLLALATCSTDPEDLKKLAAISCPMEKNQSGNATGLIYKAVNNRPVPVIHNHPLFEAVANNPYLPDSYKRVMVIRPGAQGGSEIVGDWVGDGSTHVYEYLRKNSYIPWGHYAANMADDAVRYSINDLSACDIQGLRHLYYQRSFVRIAEELGITLEVKREKYSEQALENLRLNITHHPDYKRYSSTTLWGWNFGFDFSPSLYRLHASHQQIHQQYAIIPDEVTAYHNGIEKTSGTLAGYSCGDLISDLVEEYSELHDSDFFSDFLKAITCNKRMDGRDSLDSSLVVWSDSNVMLFVPKAQTSQWELQLMSLPDKNCNLAGNILEADTGMRQSLDTGILTAQKVLAGLGARMVTSFEYSRRPGKNAGLHQPLLYVFLPRLPQSPGAFSEAQLRFINGHYPEDFARACRSQL